MWLTRMECVGIVEWHVNVLVLALGPVSVQLCRVVNAVEGWWLTRPAPAWEPEWVCRGPAWRLAR